MSNQESIAAIESNAKRLLEDAKLLQKNDRYRTSFSIAILAIEEAGKACLLKWQDDGLLKNKLNRKDVLSHKSKQRIFATFIFIDSLLRAIIELCDDKECMQKIFSNNSEINNDENPAKYLLGSSLNRVGRTHRLTPSG